MTDTELSALEAAAKAATPGPWNKLSISDNLYLDSVLTGVDVLYAQKYDAAYIAAANPAAILELVQELRQMRAERDWIADYIATLTGKKSYNTKEHWIKAAKDAVNNNPQPHPQYAYEL